MWKPLTQPHGIIITGGDYSSNANVSPSRDIMFHTEYLDTFLKLTVEDSKCQQG